MVFPDHPGFTGEPPGLRPIQRGPPMLAYLTDAGGGRMGAMAAFNRYRGG
jgi:hypothetical protein